MTPAERFWSYVAKGDGCWTWTGYIDAKGYGRVSMPAPVSKLVQAHRWSYEQMVGPIPDGLELDHLCRNRACVNPAHLEAVTHAENVRRGRSPSAIHAAKETCPNGHPYDAVHGVASGKRIKRVCKRCANERKRAKRAQRRAERGLPPFTPAQCGTTSGYERHRVRGEQPCEPCREAEKAYMREYNRTKRKKSAS